MEEKGIHRRLAGSPPCRPLRRRRFLPLALFFALAVFYYYFAAKPSISDYARSKFLSGGAISSLTTQKIVSHQEQEALANIPFETPSPQVATTVLQPAEAGSVELEAHIMSKCPDAEWCIRELIIPAMVEVASLVNFTLSFIGSFPDEGNDAVSCMHGPQECLGNMLMLCVDNMYPDAPIISLGFANCLLRHYERIPERELVQNCALEQGVDFQRLNECVSDDARGEQFLRKSVKWSQDEHVSKSCTVRVNRRTWCVRDDNQWKDCSEGSSEPSSLVERIRTLARAT